LNISRATVGFMVRTLWFYKSKCIFILIYKLSLPSGNSSAVMEKKNISNPEKIMAPI
jgi:hypothetical protein